MTTKKSSKSSPSPAPSSPASKPTRLQKFTMQRVWRKAIQGADYNPRVIDIHARKKLEKNLQTVGLLQPIVVNATTMNVLSGHQRLAIIDTLESKGDYELDVAMVTLDPDTEKTQNVFMNNAAAMGTWDQMDLDELLRSLPTELLPDTGFEQMDIAVLTNDDELASMFAEANASPEVKETLSEIDQIADIKEAKKLRGRERHNDSENYAVVVFKDRAAQTRFVLACGCDASARYVDSERVLRLLSDKAQKLLRDLPKAQGATAGNGLG